MDNLYNEIKTLIEEVTNEKGKEFTMGKFTGLGWLDFHYKNSIYDGQYPRISIKQYDKKVHFYCMLWKDGVPVISNYVDLFGKSNVGQSCIRIRKLNDERKEALREIVEIAKEYK